jgi:hypothetical protein
VLIFDGKGRLWLDRLLFCCLRFWVSWLVM